jgi:hypothetical protein
MCRTLVAAVAALVVACGGGAGGADGHGEPQAQRQDGATINYPATLTNESGQPASVGLTYWIVRPIEYGTNRGWQPLLNEPLAAGASLSTAVSVPEGEQVAVQLVSWSGGRWQESYVVAEPRGSLRLALGADGAPFIQWTTE